MEWFIILLALAVVIGPILYLVPSEKDRYITALRALARKQGYTVQIDKVLKLDPSSDERVTAGGGVRQPALACARYQKPLGVSLNNLTPIILMRLPDQPTMPVELLQGKWGVAAADPVQYKALQQWRSYAAASTELISVLGQLPDDVLAVQFDKRFVAAFWTERNPQAKQIKNQPLALFWPARRSAAPKTLAEFPGLQQLDKSMAGLVNVVKKHWGVSND